MAPTPRSSWPKLVERLAAAFGKPIVDDEVLTVSKCNDEPQNTRGGIPTVGTPLMTSLMVRSDRRVVGQHQEGHVVRE